MTAEGKAESGRRGAQGSRRILRKMRKRIASQRLERQCLPTQPLQPRRAVLHRWAPLARRAMSTADQRGSGTAHLRTQHLNQCEVTELVALRRDLHEHPELGFEENRTAAIVAEKLESWGINTTTGIARTGVVGTLQGKEPGSCSIGLRADMDALPITEETGLPHQSTNPGVMHACGHDGHTTMLLGAAKYLARTRNFRGTVHFFFQPNEEGVYWPTDMPDHPQGAKLMCDEGLFERFPCDHVFGIHNWPELQPGQVGLKSGSLMASEDNFQITIKGVGGHAAMPHLCIDSVLVGSHVVTALHGLISRITNPVDRAVLSVSQFQVRQLAHAHRPHCPPDRDTSFTAMLCRPTSRLEGPGLLSTYCRSRRSCGGRSAASSRRPGSLSNRRSRRWLKALPPAMVRQPTW